MRSIAPLSQRVIAIVAVLSSGLLSCSRSPALETIELSINGERFTVEVARTPEEQQRGLMYRRSLAEDKGMLFAYDSDRMLSFWMKNTYIPLSIAFLSSDGVIREIHDMEPESQRTIPSSRSVRFALELNQGAFARVGAEPGTRVVFPEGFH